MGPQEFMGPEIFYPNSEHVHVFASRAIAHTHVIVLGRAGPPHETCGWLYAALSERQKKRSAPRSFLHFDLRPQVAVGLQGFIAGGCIAGGCIVVVTSPCIRITCEYIHSCGDAIEPHADTCTHVIVL